MCWISYIKRPKGLFVLFILGHNKEEINVVCRNYALMVIRGLTRSLHNGLKNRPLGKRHVILG
ncbi:MAG: hypothetical protein A4E56_00673 [Pelotomaculum sp. PtaU1.Bin065]|nr:MAG: hypothetical protein A4E56_00673 [Pelotomaculum sp. PtaU1.Bin065]